MLKKSERLTEAAFDEYFKRGTQTHRSQLQLIYTEHPRFHGSVVVGKKVYKRAVDRNKKRRQIYNLLYQLRTKYELSGVFIVIAKPGVKELSFSQLRDEVEALVAPKNHLR